MARPAFKAFLNLLPVLPALLFAFSCSREERGPLAEGISHSGREDGRLVFRAAASDTKAPAFSRDTVLALTENGEKSPFSLKVSMGNRAVASEGTKPACDPYGSNNLPESFAFTIYSEDGGVARIDSDIAVRNGDRWISRKDWSEKIPAYTNAPTICAFVNDDVTGQSDIDVYVVDNAKYFYAVLANEANVGGDLYNDFCTPDLLWGYGEYSGLRADNSIVFRHVGAALCVHCAPALDMSVTGVELVARLNGYMEWRATDAGRKYSDATYSSDTEVIYGYQNISLSNGDTWIVPKDEPIILPPQCGFYDGNAIYLRLYVAYNGDAHALEADISDIEFYSGSMTTLEVTMDSFLWLNAPDVSIPFENDEIGNHPKQVVIDHNIHPSDWESRTLACTGNYVTAAFSPDDPSKIIFTPRCPNITTDWVYPAWTDTYTVTCLGVSSTGTVTVEPSDGHRFYLCDVDGFPEDFFFVGEERTLPVNVYDDNTGFVYPVHPSLIMFDESEEEYLPSRADCGRVVCLADCVTQSRRTYTVSIDGGLYCQDSWSHEYEIARYVSSFPSSLHFGSTEFIQEVGAVPSSELVAYGNEFLLRNGETISFALDGDKPYVISYRPETDLSSDLLLTYESTDGEYFADLDYYSDFGGSPMYKTLSQGFNPSARLVVHAYDNALFGIYSGTLKEVTVACNDNWSVVSAPDWLRVQPGVGVVQQSRALVAESSKMAFCAEPNYGSVSRTGVVAIDAGFGGQVNITVVQEPSEGASMFSGGGFSGGGGTNEDF